MSKLKDDLQEALSLFRREKPANLAKFAREQGVDVRLFRNRVQGRKNESEIRPLNNRLTEVEERLVEASGWRLMRAPHSDVTQPV